MRLLGNRNLFLIAQGQFVSLAGSSINVVVLALWTFEVTGDATVVGIVMLCSTLPQVLVGPVAGVIVDRADKRQLVVLADTAMGLSMLSISIPVFLLDWPATEVVFWLMGAVAINGICSAVFQPALFAIVPSIVSRDALDDANSLLTAAGSTASIIGMAIGGVLYRLLGGPIVFLLDGVSFLLSGLSESFLKVPKTDRADREPATVWDDMVFGAKRFWQFRGMRNAFLLFTGWNFVTGTNVTALPVLVTQVHGQSEAWFGYILAATSVGSLLGLACFNRLDENGRARLWLFTGTQATDGLGMMAMALTPNGYAAVAVGVVMGLAVGPMNVMLRTVVQATVPSDIIGRVFSIGMVLVGASIPIGFVFWGYAIEMADHNAPLMLTICGSAIVFFLVVTSLSRDYRTFMATEI